MTLFLLCFLGLSEPTLTPEHQALSFMIGTWRTESTWPESGEKVQGTLTYEWIVAGHWMKFTFQGKHPTRPYWEAHGVIQYDAAAKSYRSIAVWGPDGPHEMKGTLVKPGLFRVQSESNGLASGIDYMARDGAVYQENWRMDKDGKRIVTLQTTYKAMK